MKHGKVIQLDDTQVSIDLDTYMNDLVRSTFTMDISQKRRVRFEGPHGSGSTMAMVLYLSMNLILGGSRYHHRLVLTETPISHVRLRLRALMYLILSNAGKYLGETKHDLYNGFIDVTDESIFRIINDKLENLSIYVSGDLTLNSFRDLPNPTFLYVERIDELVMPTGVSGAMQVIGCGTESNREYKDTCVFKTRGTVNAIGKVGGRDIAITGDTTFGGFGNRAAVIDMDELSDVTKHIESMEG